MMTASASAPSTGAFVLAELEILVGVSAEAGGEQILRQLQRDRAKVRSLWPLPDKVPGDVDALVLEQGDGLIDRLPWMPGGVHLRAGRRRGGRSTTGSGPRFCDCSPDAILFTWPCGRHYGQCPAGAEPVRLHEAVAGQDRAARPEPPHHPQRRAGERHPGRHQGHDRGCRLSVSP